MIEINPNAEKIIVVISDIHLGAGQYLFGKKNLLEDFFHDTELINFFRYFKSCNQKVEIIINGDFLDFLAVPYVNFFDDEYWSEAASVEKLKLIYNGHKEVFEAMSDFLGPDKKITYIIGNHDAELVLPAVRRKLLSFFDPIVRDHLKLVYDEDTYQPAPGVFLQHGHQYERAHIFDPQNTTIKAQDGQEYLIPAWGSYYCYRVLNKYKPEREYINQIMPIKQYLIHGLIFDTFFTLRFMLANVYYFNMIRFWNLYLSKFKLDVILRDIKEELVLFQNYEKLTRKFFHGKEEAKILLTGHTHFARYRAYHDGTTFINTGTWTRLINLDFSYNISGHNLTFALIELEKEDYTLKEFHRKVRSRLLEWSGHSNLPYKEFRH